MVHLSTITPIVLGVLCFAGFGVFAIVSAREGERRAVRVFAAISGCAAVPLVAAPFLPRPLAATLAAIGIVLIVPVLIRCLVPLRRPRESGGRPTHRVDERDIMFARGRLRPGTPEFDAYYRLRDLHEGVSLLPPRQLDAQPRQESDPGLTGDQEPDALGR